MRAAAATAADSPHSGWHRKWLVLCAVLVWIYFLRFRLLGWLLSQALTLSLRVRAPRLKARAQIQYITLRPLQIGHIEISSGTGDWRFVCTRVTIETHVREFFRSFVQRKILVVAIEDVYVDLLRLDEELVREMVRQSEPSVHGSSRSKATENEQSPLGAMRFVDFQVRKISANIDVFETYSRFRCSELCINIPEVFLDQNILHLSITASSVFAASTRQQRRGSSGRVPGSLAHRNSNSRDEISCELTNVSAVLDVELTGQAVIGCNLESKTTEPANFRISTAYIEHLLLKKMELIRGGLFPISKSLWSAGDGDNPTGSRPAGPKVPQFALRIVDFPIAVDLSHKLSGDTDLPLHITTRIRLLKYLKGGKHEFSGQRPADDQITVNKSRDVVRMILDCQQLEIRSQTSASEIFAVTCCRTEMSRDDSGRGIMQCQLGDMQMAVDPAHCRVLHSLILFPDIVDDYERSALQLMLDDIGRKRGKRALSLTRKPPTQWSVNLKADSWSLRSWLVSKGDGDPPDLEANGRKTVLRSEIPPKKSGLMMTHAVDMADVTAKIVVRHFDAFPLMSSSNTYTLRFADISVSTTKLLSPPGSSKSTEIKVQSSRVSLNDHSKNLKIEGDQQLPGLLITDFAFQQSEIESDEELRLTFKASASDADVVLDHSNHKRTTTEVRSVGHVLDQVRLMLTPPELQQESEKLPRPLVDRYVGVGLLVSSICIRVVDIQGVSRSVQFCVSETSVSFKKGPNGNSTIATCAFLDLLWANGSSVMQAAGVRLDQITDSQPSDNLLPLVESTTQSDITLSHLHLSLRSDCRLLMLFLELDELFNTKEESGSPSAPKLPSKQTVGITCTTMEVNFFDDSSANAVGSVGLDRLRVRANMSRSFQINDFVVRYLQLTRRDESCRSRLTNCIQILGLKGFVGVQSVVLRLAEQEVLNLEESDVKFTISDATYACHSPEKYQGDLSYIPPKFLLFDMSVFGKLIRIKTPPDCTNGPNVILPVLKDALDTRPKSATGNSDTEELDDWMLRYVGSLDCAFEEAIGIVPIERNIFHGGDQLLCRTPDRFIVIRADRIVLGTRQFQKLAIQFELIRVVLADHMDDSANVSSDHRPMSDQNLPLQLVLLPRTKIDAVIHWRPPTIGTHAQQFALSFDLVIRGNPSTTTDLVPIADETLVALNWEYIFPLMVFILAEDECRSDRSKDTAASDKRFECVGIQWNLSVDVLQLAWWDAMTQESAILLVCHDLLSHGIARVYREGGRSSDAEPAWVLWETTIYLDLFRCYILHDAHAEEEYITLACGALPFEPSPPSHFFFETTGTSYRATHVHCGDEVTSIDDGGALFGDLAFGVADKLHDDFEHASCSFVSGSSNRFQRVDSTSTVGTETSASPSPPKSPRAWTQTVRAKLARLKRRTTSMDNMLLNDGSRPIQVDSMKLLWTIESRDCAFNMIAVTSDSIDVIRAASDRRCDERGSAPVHPLHESLTHSTSPKATRRDLHAATLPTVEDLRGDSVRGRRSSTRETLLELLHQGKLGKKDSTTLHHDDDSASPRQHSGNSRSDSEEMHLSKAIEHKLYTLDVHDAQINILEEMTGSTALIASKHIHLEIGTAKLGTTTIAALKFENVTGHIAPLNVEVSTGVAWYSYQKGSTHLPTSPRGAPNPLLLKQVMEEFSLTSTYSQATATGATAVEVDMSSLQLSTDRHQFYQLLNVLRHVLLAPPTIIRRAKRTFTYRRENASESSTLSVDDVIFPMASTPTVAAHTGKKLHAQLVEEMRQRDSKQLGTSRSTQFLLKLISFRSAGCVYRLRTSPESTGGDHEFVEIRAEGITGSHMYFLSQSTKLVINLEWMEINNLRPGPSSIAFEDPMAVLKAKLLIGERYQSSSRVALTNQKGMLSVRAESGPQTRVLGQKLRILDVLEVSIFPEIPNMIIIQLAADFYELVYKFFFEHINTSEHQETHQAESVLFGKKGSASSLSSMPTPITVTVPQSPVTKSRAYASPSSPPHPVSIRRKSVQMSSSVTSTGSESALTASNLSILTCSGEPSGDDDDSTADGHELYYFKYVRIGNVRLRINCNGFFVNLNNFDLDLPPYVCQSKLCTWKKLLQKFESHLKWHVTKETASTGLSHFKNKLLKWTPTAGDKKEKQKKEEDTATMNAQVLFGPYSGTH